MGESRGGSHLNKSKISSAGAGLVSPRALSHTGAPKETWQEVPSGGLEEVPFGFFTGVLTVVLTGVFGGVLGTATEDRGTGDMRRHSFGSGPSASLDGNSGGRERQPDIQKSRLRTPIVSNILKA